MAACFSPNGVQILTCGTDRKITYWETLDGSMVREIEGSGSGALNSINISADGQYFVTGGNDSIVKLWSYETGESTHVGIGHAAIITACKISPDGKHIVTVSGDGAIMIWKCPFEMKSARSSSKRNAPSVSSRSTCSLREEELKKRLILDLGDENVADFSPRSEGAESVKAVYKGMRFVLVSLSSKILNFSLFPGSTETPLCKCDPIQPIPNSCKCKEGDVKSPIIETTRSSKSSKSEKSRKSEPTLRSCKSNESSIKNCSLERKSLV